MFSSTSNEFPCCSAITRSYHCCCMAFWACSRSDCVMEVLQFLGQGPIYIKRHVAFDQGPGTRKGCPYIFHGHTEIDGYRVYYEALRCCFCSLYSWLSCVISAF